MNIQQIQLGNLFGKIETISGVCPKCESEIPDTANYSAFLGNMKVWCDTCKAFIEVLKVVKPISM